MPGIQCWLHHATRFSCFLFAILIMSPFRQWGMSFSSSFCFRPPPARLFYAARARACRFSRHHGRQYCQNQRQNRYTYTLPFVPNISAGWFSSFSAFLPSLAGIVGSGRRIAWYYEYVFCRPSVPPAQVSAVTVLPFRHHYMVCFPSPAFQAALTI